MIISDSFHLRSKGYEGIINVAMDEFSYSTGRESQKNLLMRYYQALFKAANGQHINTLVMSCFGEGPHHHDFLLSIWSFFQVYENLPTEQLDQTRVTLLVSDHRLANVVRRAQMEPWPQTHPNGWETAFFNFARRVGFMPLRRTERKSVQN